MSHMQRVHVLHDSRINTKITWEASCATRAEGAELNETATIPMLTPRNLQSRSRRDDLIYLSSEAINHGEKKMKRLRCSRPHNSGRIGSDWD
eukprot:6568451-Prymnesium_polylepis.1